MVKSRTWISLCLVLCVVLVMIPMLAHPAHAALTDTSIGVSFSGSFDSNYADGTEVYAKRYGWGNDTYSVTLTNNSGAEATLSFVYTMTEEARGGSVSVAYYKNSSASATTLSISSGSTFKQTLEAGGKVVISATTAKMGTVIVKLTDVALKIKTAADVTFAPDSAVSYTVGYVDADGASQTATVTAGGSNVTVEAELSEGFVITPTTDGYACESSTGTTSGTVYVGGNGAFTFAKNETVTPVFISSSAVKPFTHLGVNKTYHNLNAAGNAGSGTVVLNQDYTLPAGDYTIPYGVTLLIPCDDANTVYTTQPGDDGGDSYTTPTVYRKLTLAEGANITVNGDISMGGKIGTLMSSTTNTDTTIWFTDGAPSGPLGCIEMNSGSDITVASGGNLYAWGFVTGSGAVTVKDGGTIYENLQIRDWRGGNATSDVLDGKDTYEVFPFSQYYIQNVEVPLTIEAGATQSVCTAISYTSISLSGTYAASTKVNATFIGSGSGLIRLSDGSLTRTYDASTDRIIYDLNGDISFANLNISITIALGESVSINSEDFVMPLNSNMTLNVNSGSEVTVSQDFELLPGGIIEIDSGATVTLGSGKRIFVYDTTEWDGYSGVWNEKFRAVQYSPSSPYTRKASDLVDAKLIVNGTLDATEGAIYTTFSGANITSDGGGVVKLPLGSQTTAYQVVQSDNAVGSWAEIPITNAQLLNSDGTYVATAGSGTSPNTYTYTDGEWICATHTWDNACDTECNVCGTTRTITHSYVETSTTATCTEAGTATFTCSVCSNTKTEADEALGHSWTDATCTDAKTCSVCGTTEGEALGHSWTNDCDTDCNREGCDHTRETTHAYESVVTAPTCTTGGYTTHTCSRCSDSYTDSAVAANGHNLGEWIVDAAATCTEAGSQHKECENCDYTESGTIEALGHDEETHAAQAPTCTAIGWDAYVTCSRCDYSTYAEKTALGHDMVTDAAVEATCTATGLTEGSHCSRCDGATTAQEVVPAKGHTDADSDGDHICDRDGCSEVVSTCGDSGKDHICDSDSACTVYSTGDNAHADSDSDKDHVCDYCGKEVENGETCSDVTTDNDHSCDVCGKENVSDHDYDAVVTAPTHTTAGYTTYTCNCGHSYTGNETAALGHSYTSSVTTEPTCTEAGVRTYTCECGHSYTEAIEATGHVNTEVINAKDATCGADGYTGDTYCNDCQTTIETGESIEATGEHSYEWETTTAATCVATGVETGTCSCGTTTTREIEIDSDAHNLVSVEAKAATCTEAGYTAHTDCSRCDHTEGYEVIPATGHVNTTTITVDASCTADGSVTVTCACGHVVSTEVIKSEGHTYGNPSYTWNGTTLTVTLTCGNCAEGTEDRVLAGSADGAVESSTEGDCKTEATTTYTATVTLNGQDYTDETTIKGELGNHSYVDGTCTVCGTADPDASTTTKPTVTVTNPANGTVIAYDIVEAESGWTLTLTAEDTANTYVYLVKYTDADGNESEKIANVDGKYNGDSSFAIPAQAAAVTVKGVLLGDIYMDGAVNGKDLTRLRQILAGTFTNTDELVGLAADTYQDSTITGKDLTRMRQYLAGTVSAF